MSLFKKLFTEKMFFIVVGTCVRVLVVFFTLGIIEGVVIESNGETRWAAWRNRLEEVNQVLNKEKVVLYTDTVQGEMFGFKDLMVIPVLELTRDSTGEHRKMLNFQMYDAARGIQCLLFQEHRHIFDSRMVKVKDAVLWIMESDTVVYLYDSRESHYIASNKNPRYRLLYPFSKSDLLKDDVADPDEVTPKEQKSPVTLPDVYCDDNVYPSFSVVNGHLIISAEYVRYQGRMHWAYDLQSRRIIAFPLQQNTGN